MRELRTSAALLGHPSALAHRGQSKEIAAYILGGPEQFSLTLPKEQPCVGRLGAEQNGGHQSGRHQVALLGTHTLHIAVQYF